MRRRLILGGLLVGGAALAFLTLQTPHPSQDESLIGLSDIGLSEALGESEPSESESSEARPGEAGSGEAEAPTGPWISPSGRLVHAGDRNAQGYLLPRDLRRPKKPRDAKRGLESGANRPRNRRFTGPLPTGPFPEARLGPDDGGTENETSIDASGQTLVAGWNQFADGGLTQGFARSGDGGATWSFQLLDQHAVASDPVVVHAGGDRWYFAYIGNGPDGGDIDVYVRRSDDDGVTWQSAIDATNNGDFDDKPYMAARGDEVLIGFADFAFSPAKLSVVRSLDGGLNWSAQEALSDLSVGGNGASPVIAPDGTYYVFWRDSFQEFVWMSKSQDQGSSWSQDASIAAMSPLPSSMPPGYRIVNLPSAAAHPITGTLLVVWNDQAFGDPDILSVRSTDGGDTWSSAIRVPTENAGAAQFFPWLTFDESGIAWVVWYDKRENGSDIDVYIASSPDAGLSWDPEIRVTAAAFTPLLPTEPGAAAFIGDYNGIAASQGSVYPFYQDARRGEQDVWVAIVDTFLFRDDFESGDTTAWSLASP